ncbi:MAG TPA: TIGR03960 family B12-binding radical SAM protein [Spirochaetota bacterium]|nr:TIGR03960 family B12-binding radical SAM protein [Spirochaetota bacterium]
MTNKEIERRLGDFLHLVQKPARYVGGEYNITVKENADVRIALSYPDLYDIGMANNGIRILYEAVNRIDGIACERVFAVAPDFEAELKKRDIPLYTLETYTPLCDLDMIGFNIAHELCLTNILHILDLGKIPLLRSERKDGDPIVIAGGEFTSNPFPVADFIDLFFIGEGEEGLPEAVETLKRCKAAGMKRSDIIAEIGKLPGLLVSGDYSFRYEGLSTDISCMKKVKKRSINCEAAVSINKPIVPSIRISQERGVVELSRGCFNLCKFCHAGYYNMPYRTFSSEKVAEEIYRQIDNTGYDEVTLTSLSASDYKYLVTLLNKVLPGLTERGVSLSLPSLKVDKNTLPIIETISSVRKSSLTFAVESASEEIRGISNKKVKTDDLLEIVDFVFKNGWKTIKLYFMIGLPGCEEVDEAESIIDLLKKIARLGNRKDINVTISPFVPKPHTPFQYNRQMDMEYFYEVIRKIKSAAPRQVTIKNHNVKSSFLEGLISRSDERMGRVIYQSYLDGAKFDSWSEYFNFEIWMKNIEELLPHWRDYLDVRDPVEVYPWQVIETGSEKAVEAMRGRKLDIANYRQPEKRYAEPLNCESKEAAMKKFEEKYPTAQTLRFVFSKTGGGRYIPHIDFIENIKRAFRMAGLPLSFTQGFNKREKISAGFPVPVGIESMAEIADVELYRALTADEINAFIPEINSRLPKFIKVERVSVVTEKGTVMGNTFAVKYCAELADADLVSAAAASIDKNILISKTGKSGVRKEFPVSEMLHSFEIDGNTMHLKLFAGRESSIRIDEFLAALTGSTSIPGTDAVIMKICQYRETPEGLQVIQ